MEQINSMEVKHMDKNKKICYCFNVSVDDIERAIENGADTFQEASKM